MEQGFNTVRRFPLRFLITWAGARNPEAPAPVRAPESVRRTKGPSSSNPSRADGVFSPGRFAAILAVLIFAAFPEVLLGERTLLYRDFGLFGYPLAQYHRECFWRGELPLWNPLSACGIPFLAQWNTLTLYPLSLIYLLGPLPWSLNFFCFAHLFLAGMGMYFLGSRWSRSHLAGAVAGAAFAFGGVMLTSLIWPAYMAALGWMPWVVLTVASAWQKGGRQLALAGLVGAMQMLTGAPEIILLTWFFLGGLWLGDLLGQRIHRQQTIWRFPFLILLVAVVAAVQLLPFLDLLVHSHRDPGFGLDRWAMPAWGWANLVVPLFRSYPSAYGVHVQAGQNLLASYYPGIVTVALSLVAILFLRDRRFWIAACTALLFLVLAWGDNSWLYAWLRDWIPQIGFMRFPVKFVLLPSLLFPLMAALAIGALQRQSRPQRKEASRSAIMVWLGLLALLTTIVCLSQGYPIEGESWRKVLPNAAARFGFLTLSLAGLFALLLVPPKKGSAVLQVALVLLIAADGWTHLPVVQPTATPGILAPGFLELNPKPEPGLSRAYVAMSAHRELYRFLPDLEKTYAGYRLGGVDNTPLLDGIPTIDGFYPLYLREQRGLWTELFFKPDGRNDGLLDFLSVAQLSTNKLEWAVRATALPWITAGQTPLFLDGPQTLARLRSEDFDPRQEVCLPDDERGVVTATHHSDARVTQPRFNAHRLEFEVDAASTSMVTLSQSFYHPWKAFVDGKSVPLLRANHAFQALEVPSGNSHVELVYRDNAFRVGAWISVGGLLVCAGLCRRSRHASKAGPETSPLSP